MALTFTYEKSTSPIFGTIHRPIAQVYLFASMKNRWYETWMIVDTGADYTLLPKYFAQRLNVDLKKDCTVFKTAGIGGLEKVYLFKQLKVKLGKWIRNVPVGFLDHDNIPPLLGRHLFLDTFEVLFSSNHTISFSSN